MQVKTSSSTRRADVCWGWTLALVCAAILTVPALPALGQSPTGRLLDLINQDRAQHGIGPVALSSSVSVIAQGHAQAMAAARRIFQNPAFPGNVPAANAAGENVGYATDVDSVHAAFVASPEHQVNIVNRDYTMVGIGLANSAVGLMVVEEFVDTADAAAPAPMPLQAHPAPAAPPSKAAPAPAPPPVAAPPAPPLAVPAPPPVAAPPPRAAAPAPRPVAVPKPRPQAPPPPPPPSFDVALYARMLNWAQWQVASNGSAGR